jgi:hypothetical protein
MYATHHTQPIPAERRGCQPQTSDIRLWVELTQVPQNANSLSEQKRQWRRGWVSRRTISVVAPLQLADRLLYLDADCAAGDEEDP